MINNEINNNAIYFWGGDSFLSNFYPVEYVNSEGMKVFSSEQDFMSKKAFYFGDMKIYDKILKAQTPKEAKTLGWKVNGFNEEEWNKAGGTAMECTVVYKFLSSRELATKLVKTGNLWLFEASPYDKKWGIGLDEATARRTPMHLWPGQNLLGKTLQNVREEISNHEILEDM